MFEIILYQPEIPPNTGNIIRLSANTGCTLHLIEPLGFQLEDKQLRRAGLDYHEWANMKLHNTLEDCISSLANPSRIFALSSKAQTMYTRPCFQKGDAFLFGPETRGLSKEILNNFPQEKRLKLPQHTLSRSLNLSNSVAIMIYEAWRQLDFS